MFKNVQQSHFCCLWQVFSKVKFFYFCRRNLKMIEHTALKLNKRYFELVFDEVLFLDGGRFYTFRKFSGEKLVVSGL